MNKIIQGQRSWDEFKTTGRVGFITTLFSEQFLLKSYKGFRLSNLNYKNEIKKNRIDTVFIDNDLFERDHEWYKKNRGHIINYLKNNNINICVIKNTTIEVSQLFKKAFILFINPALVNYKYSKNLVESPILLNHFLYNPINSNIKKDILYLNFRGIDSNLKSKNYNQERDLIVDTLYFNIITREKLIDLFDLVKNYKIIYITYPILLDEITLKYLEYICYLNSTYVIYGHKNKLDSNLFLIEDFQTQNNKISMYLRNPEYLFKEILSIQRKLLIENTFLLKQDINEFTIEKMVKNINPEISVITATNRRANLEKYTERLSKQNIVKLEINLVTHGFEVTEEEEENIKNCINGEVNIQSADSDINLGECLNKAIKTSTYPVITKMDDDDLYLENYLIDQWMALKYSRADLVGKSEVHFYFETKDIVAVVKSGDYNKYCEFVYGSTFMSPAKVFKDIMFDDLRKSEDTKFINELLKRNGRIYAGNSYEFCVYRSHLINEHTWQISDLSFLKNANIVGHGNIEAHFSIK